MNNNEDSHKDGIDILIDSSNHEKNNFHREEEIQQNESLEKSNIDNEYEDYFPGNQFNINDKDIEWYAIKIPAGKGKDFIEDLKKKLIEKQAVIDTGFSFFIPYDKESKVGDELRSYIYIGVSEKIKNILYIYEKNWIKISVKQVFVSINSLKSQYLKLSNIDFVVGSVVMIEGSSFSGNRGTIEKISQENDTATVNLSVLSMSLKVVVPLSNLKRMIV
jgi:transcription antitermination factor NusG